MEGLIFVSGDEGITKDKLKVILDISDSDLNKYLSELISDYDNDNRGMQIKLFGDVIKMTTKEIHKDYYQKLTDIEESTFLSQGALETLAIIAYNGPITRIGIDEIRGVNTSYLIRKLLDREFIKDVGKSDAPGRPTLYEVNNKFFDYFGLKSLDDLPKMNMDINEEEIDLFDSKYKEE